MIKTITTYRRLRRALPSRPSGACENSPAFQRWVRIPKKARSPAGTKELCLAATALPFFAIVIFLVAGCSYHSVELSSQTSHDNQQRHMKTKISSGTFLNGKVQVENIQTTNTPTEQSLSVDHLRVESGGIP